MWLTYLLIVTFTLFWIANITAAMKAEKLFKELCKKAPPSQWSPNWWKSVKTCLFALNKNEIGIDTINKIDGLKKILKVQNLSFLLIMIIAIGLFIKQGFRFV